MKSLRFLLLRGMTIHKLWYVALCAGLTASPGFLVQAWAQQAESYEIVQVADGLYSAAYTSPRAISHRAVFLVTDEGIILADPISTEFATWLKSEIDERFGVDFVNIRLVPGALYLYSFDQYASAVETMLSPDIDTVVPGHGNVGRRDFRL